MFRRCRIQSKLADQRTVPLPSGQGHAAGHEEEEIHGLFGSSMFAGDNAISHKSPASFLQTHHMVQRINL
jgi:hypothetical protein